MNKFYHWKHLIIIESTTRYDAIVPLVNKYKRIRNTEGTNLTRILPQEPQAELTRVDWWFIVFTEDRGHNRII